MPTPTKNINAEKIQGNLSLDTISATTISAATYYNAPVTTGVTISNGVVAFNRVDSQSAYTVTYSGVNLSVVSDNINKVVTFSATTGPQTNRIYVDSTYGADVAGNGDSTKPYLTVEYALSSTTNTGLFTGGTTSGSTTLSNISNAQNATLKVGQYVTGAGIPFGTIIVAKGNEGINVNTITLSKPATATASNVSLTWWTIYEVFVNGNFNATSTWFKQGFYLNLTSNTNVWFGNLTLININAVQIMPYILNGSGNFYGTHVSSVFFSNGTSNQNTDFTLDINFNRLETVGTGYAFSCYANHAGMGSNCTFKFNYSYVNASFGRIATITGYSSTGTGDSFIFNGSNYALLEGFYINLNTKLEIYGDVKTPSAVNALNLAGGMITMKGNVYGSITQGAGSYTHQGGSIVGSTLALNGTSVITSDYVNPNISGSGTVVWNVKNYNAFLTGSVTITNYGTVTYYIFTGTLYNYGTANYGYYFYNGATVYNYGTMGAVQINAGATVRVYNYGLINGYVVQNGVGGSPIIENYANIDISTAGGNGIDLKTTSTFVNRGKIFNSSINNTITLNDGTFSNFGVIESTNTGSTLALITKVGGTLKLYPGSYLKVGNLKSPIKCTTSGSTSRDIYMFNCITNCNGSTYGLGFAFDGSSYAPNDLVGGTKYENINY